MLFTVAMLHAKWWQAPDLANASWLRLRSLTAPEAMADAFSHGWPTFLQKLSIPVSSQMSETGDWIRQNLHEATTILFDSGPRTLIHNDVQADNLFFGEADENVIFVDWQMATYARCVIDVANWVRGQLEPEVRRTAESQLLQLYHDALVANGVQDYTFEQCMADYRLATVLAPARLACAVGLSEELMHIPVHSGTRCFLAILIDSVVGVSPGHVTRINGRPIAQWSRLQAGRSDHLAAGALIGDFGRVCCFGIAQALQYHRQDDDPLFRG